MSEELNDELQEAVDTAQTLEATEETDKEIENAEKTSVEKADKAVEQLSKAIENIEEEEASEIEEEPEATDEPTDQCNIEGLSDSLTTPLEEEEVELVEPKKIDFAQRSREGMTMTSVGRMGNVGKRPQKTGEISKETKKRRGVYQVYKDKEVANVGKGPTLSDVQKTRGTK